MAEHIHLIGIGGTGMAALAGLLKEDACRVTGSDRGLYPPTSELLAEMGLTVHAGFDAARLRPAPDLVVIGNAVRRGNPEAEEVLDRRLPYTSMPRLIAERFLSTRHSIVVAGTHGKTTTAAMLAWVLEHAGHGPGFLVGGLPRNLPRPYRLGTGQAFVIEGDEYDTAFFDKGPKFMHYRPDTALVGTVEYDHADIYRDLGQVEQAFRWFTNIVPGRGLLVRHEDCDVTRAVTDHALARIEGYGLSSGRWRAGSVRDGEEGISFRVECDGRAVTDVRMRLSGEYNVLNALAVVAAATEQGLRPEEITEGLATFEGVRRRMEIRGTADGVTVVDDFAHHPTAIAATLTAARRRFAGRRIWAVLEPRSWSLRLNVFQDRLPAAFDGADEVVIAEVFGSESIAPERRLDAARLAGDLAARGRPARFLSGVDTIVEHLAGRCAPGDVVVVLSNGGFGGIHAKLLDAFSARAASP